MSLLSEALVISGVAMDLVGATVLSHAHNAESMVDIREEIGVEKSALGEKDATQAQLLAEKRKKLSVLRRGGLYGRSSRLWRNARSALRT